VRQPTQIYRVTGRMKKLPTTLKPGKGINGSDISRSTAPVAVDILFELIRAQIQIQKPPVGLN
jgi:hypothetical protein